MINILNYLQDNEIKLNDYATHMIHVYVTKTIYLLIKLFLNNSQSFQSNIKYIIIDHKK